MIAEVGQLWAGPGNSPIAVDTEFEYDQLGNRLSRTDNTTTPATVTAYEYDVHNFSTAGTYNHRLLSATTSQGSTDLTETTYTYNGAGQPTRIGDETLSWKNARDRDVRCLQYDNDQRSSTSQGLCVRSDVNAHFETRSARQARLVIEAKTDDLIALAYRIRSARELSSSIWEFCPNMEMAIGEPDVVIRCAVIESPHESSVLSRSFQAVFHRAETPGIRQVERLAGVVYLWLDSSDAWMEHIEKIEHLYTAAANSFCELSASMTDDLLIEIRRA